jgi:hypothetical protein
MLSMSSAATSLRRETAWPPRPTSMMLPFEIRMPSTKIRGSLESEREFAPPLVLAGHRVGDDLVEGGDRDVEGEVDPLDGAGGRGDGAALRREADARRAEGDFTRRRVHDAVDALFVRAGADRGARDEDVGVRDGRLRRPLDDMPGDDALGGLGPTREREERGRNYGQRQPSKLTECHFV